MAHEVETMAYAGETPWHGLGKPVSNDLTPEEMLKAAGLDWTVSKQPLFLMPKEGEDGMRKTTMTALVRDTDSKILTFVPDDWNPLQNKDALSFFKEYVDAGEMTMETAGSLKGGKRTWALAKTGHKFRLRFKGGKEDVIEEFLLMSNPHEYGWTISLDQTDVRVVCNNTLTLALSKASSKLVKIAHDCVFDPEAVKEALFAMRENSNEYKERAEFLITKKYKQDTVKEYFGHLFPSFSKDPEKQAIGSKNVAVAMETLDTQPGADLGEGTWWSAFNAITYLTDHKLGRTQENRLNSAWFGPMKDKKIQALNLALEYAEQA